MSWTAGLRVSTIGILALLAGALPAAGPPRPATPTKSAERDPRQAHGDFTGEFKPLLYVSDVEKSASFYRDALGFDFQGFAQSRGENYYAEMTAAGRKFGLHEPMNETQKARVGQQRLYFRVRDVDLHHARVTAWGVEPRAIKRTGWMDFFIVEDADGNEIAFALTDPQRHATDPWGVLEPTGRAGPTGRGEP